MSNAAANPSIDNILNTKESVLDKLWEINVKATILLLQVHYVLKMSSKFCSPLLEGLPDIFLFSVSPPSSFLFLFFFLLPQDAASHLRKGSSVIIISSIAGYQPEASLAMYGVTKTALLGLTKVLQRSVRIHFNNLSSRIVERTDHI